MAKTILQIVIEAITGDAVKDLKKVDKSLDEINKSSGKTAGGVGGLEKSFGLLKSAAAAFAASAVAAAIVDFGKQSVQAASDLNETMSKTTVIFGESADAIFDFADTAAVSLGQSKQQAMDAAATFAIFGKSAGLTGGELVDFSTTLTGLSSDLASFSNTTPEEAITALGAALRGESEPIRKYGVLLDDASLRQRALKMGIIETTKQALTPQQRALAAYQEILAQTGDAQGDFARTSDGLANQQRILTAQFDDLKASIGIGLIPTAIQATKELNKLATALNESARFQLDVNEAQRLGLISADELRGTLRPMQVDQEELTKRLEEYDRELEKYGNMQRDQAVPATREAIEAWLSYDDTMIDWMDDAEEVPPTLEEITKANTEMWESINAGIDSTIENWLEKIDFFQAGGWELQQQFEETKQALLDNKITPEEAEDWFGMFFVESQAIKVEMGTITADEAAQNIADTLGVTLSEALNLITQIKTNAQFDITSYIRIVTLRSERLTTPEEKKQAILEGDIGYEEGFATGARNFVVPPGYPNDSFRVGLTSGEVVNVQPTGANNYYTLNMTSNAPTSTLIRDFAIMRSMA